MLKEDDDYTQFIWFVWNSLHLYLYFMLLYTYMI